MDSMSIVRKLVTIVRPAEVQASDFYFFTILSFFFCLQPALKDIPPLHHNPHLTTNMHSVGCTLQGDNPPNSTAFTSLITSNTND